MNELIRLTIISSLVCGLEFCTAAAFSYVPPILLKAGIGDSSMTLLMGCGPLLGFIFLPAIGHLSDRCRSSYGRRRPFIIIFSSIIVLCLLVIPHSENIGIYLRSPLIGLILLVISCVLFDFSSQACLNPCEALLYDICKGTSKQSTCFFVYSFMTSIGGCFGYLVTATDWNKTFLNSFFQGQEKLVFFIVTLVFLTTLIFTLAYSNENTSLFKDAMLSDKTDQSDLSKTKHFYHVPIAYLVVLPSIVFNSIKSICQMPFVLRRLAIAECFAWSALMTFNMFYTDFVGQTIYLGNPKATSLSTERIQYDQGVRAASYGLLLHCLVAAIYAPCLHMLVKRFGIRWTFSFSMFIFAVCMIIICKSRNIMIVNLTASFTGLSTASLTSIPYILVTTYHDQREIYFSDSPTIQTRGIGSILGVLDSIYFSSQIISSIIMGYIMLIFPTTLSYIVTSFVLAVCSVWFINRIIINRDQFETYVKVNPSAINTA